MATSAAREKARASSRPKKSPKPKHWWERIVIYPALLVALVTAGPQWVDRFSAMYQKIDGPSAKAAERQAELWRKNLACSAVPFAWVNSPNNVKIDTTTCTSGDVFIRAITPDNQQFFKWIALDDVVNPGGHGGGGLFGIANAATLAGGPSSPARSMLWQAQQVDILCQKIVDDRHILRRVSTPQGCFDEVIDTYNGSVVSRKPAPCTPQC